MIYTVKAENYLKDSLVFDLANPEKSGFAIIDIQGLGSVKANISTTESAVSDGSTYAMSRVGERFITLQIVYWNGTRTAEESRELLYRIFPVKKPVTLYFKTEHRDVYIEGYTESHEPTIFSDRCLSTIGIKCPKPYFKSSRIVDTIFTGLEGGTEFPFKGKEKDSTADKGILFAEVINKVTRTIDYRGDIPSGITITIDVLAPFNNITIFKNIANENITILSDKLIKATGSNFKKGDQVIITTDLGHKSVKLYRDGLVYNIFNCLGYNTKWLNLERGLNSFSFNIGSGSSIESLNFKITSTAELFEGI